MSVLREKTILEYGTDGREIKTTVHVIEANWSEWGESKKGHFEIVIEKFFPCSIEDFKKYMKVVNKDFEHREEIHAELEKYFNLEIEFWNAEIERTENRPDSRKIQNYNRHAKTVKKKFTRYLEIMREV